MRPVPKMLWILFLLALYTGASGFFMDDPKKVGEKKEALPPAVKIGDNAPNLELRDLDDKPCSLPEILKRDGLKGKTIIVNLFAEH